MITSSAPSEKNGPRLTSTSWTSDGSAAAATIGVTFVTGTSVGTGVFFVTGAGSGVPGSVVSSSTHRFCRIARGG